jgi:hypothetical protein
MLSRSIRSLSAAALALTGVAVLAPSAQAAKPATGWRVSLRVSTPQSWLSRVAASDTRSAWVVGATYNSVTPVSYRWNGKRWTAAGITAKQVSYLSTVSTSGPTNTWAFGDKTLPGGGGVSRSLHWDGHTWATADLPNGRRTTSGYVEITRSVTLSSKDTWAFGVRGTAKADAAYIAHFDGKRWKQIPAPQKLRPGVVLDAVALSGKDIWALVVEDNTAPRVLHYDGRSWTIVASPANFDPSGDMVVRSKNDIWLAGARRVSAHQSQAGVMHFNGKKWSFVPIGTSRSAFVVGSVTDDGQGGLWAALISDSSSEIWHDVKGHWSKVTLANKAHIYGHLSHIPGTSTTFGVGTDGSGPAVFVTGTF